MRLSLALLAAALLTRGASADIITLKNGRVIEGDVVRDDGKTVKIKLKYGALTVDKSEIESIEEKPTPEQEYERRVTELDATDPKAQLALAEWALTQKLEEEAVRHFILAWTLDNDLARAKEALEERDWHLDGGEWKDRDAYYSGLGWVKHEGRWIHPLEYSWRLSQRILDGVRHKISASKARIGDARADRRRAEALVKAVERKLDEIPVRRAEGEASLARMAADLREAERDEEDAERAADRWQLLCDQERLKANRGEANSLGMAEQELRHAKLATAIARGNAAALDDSMVRVTRMLAELDAAEKLAERERERATADMGAADDRIVEEVRELAELEAEAERQEAEVKKASEAWEKAK